MKSNVEELINRIIDESNRKAIAEAEYDGKEFGRQKALQNRMDVDKKLKEVKDNMLDENPVNITFKSVDDCIYEAGIKDSLESIWKSIWKILHIISKKFTWMP